jgi:hypothetical protein
VYLKHFSLIAEQRTGEGRPLGITLAQSLLVAEKDETANELCRRHRLPIWQSKQRSTTDKARRVPQKRAPISAKTFVETSLISA